MRLRMLIRATFGAVAVVFATGLIVRFQQVALPQSNSPRQSSDLHIDPDDLDFGDVWVTDKFEWPITIHNRSPREVVVEAFAGSCSCQTFSPSKFILPAGGSRRVDITLNLRAGNPLSHAQPVGHFAAALWATTARGRTQHWQLQGRVRTAFRCDDRIDLGKVSELATSAPSFRFPLVPLTALSEVTVVGGEAFVRAGVGPFDPVRGRHELVLAPRTGLPRQRYETAVTVAAVAEGHSLPPVRVPVTFEVGEDIEAIPAVLHLGARDIDECVREPVTLRSIVGKEFTVERVRAEGAGLTVAQSERGPRAGYVAEQRVARSGSQTGRLVFTLSVPGRGVVDVAVPVTFSGHGK